MYTEKQVKTYFQRRGLKSGRDYVYRGLRPSDYTKPEIPGIEMMGKHWYTYWAAVDAKNSPLRHDSFEDAVEHLVQKMSQK
ncbi:hypothetical protein [Tateyamaria sp. ANG-S1]|uniref:hypothetical protein n=1 Tax=Tateyamaria sp. ANG-S1 TaxID=1577905 RepID=UPI00057D735D|nr:hypothetical protein [Tateyamaria sp. ANG-S1]KIC47746.1 hypothetical protein RA29_19220 [Tateyamaria sp. ANG-S1]